MIQEDHGKATLVFTIVTIIFLPLSFVTGYLGMNVADIRSMDRNQSLFWEIAAPFTVAVASTCLGIVYYAPQLTAWFYRITMDSFLHLTSSAEQNNSE